jgi:CubicO group peptidase (beta-lactamase class C family)
MKNRLKKIGKYFLITLLGLFISANLFILLSGKFYLYKGIANTYLVGEKAPTIYDLDVFYYSTLKASNNKEAWKIDDHYNKQSISDLDRSFLEEMETKAFLVFKGDTMIYEEYWDDHDNETVSNSFSMAKSVVSMLVGIAIEEGKIGSMDDHVSQYLDEFKSDKKAKITLRHLLTMSSGLDWTESGKNPISDNAESYYGWDLYGQVMRQKVIEEPGKKFNYLSGNTQILAFILQKVTGKSVGEYAQEKIWSKIGAEDEAHWSLDKENGDEKAFCCLYATGRDFGKIGKLLLNGGKCGEEQIVPIDYFNEMVSMADLGTEEGVNNQRYGLHLWLYNGLANPVYYCRGFLGQYIIAIPEEDLIIVRVGTNKLPNFSISEEKSKSASYLKKNTPKVGHARGLFRYIEIGKMIASQTKASKR